MMISKSILALGFLGVAAAFGPIGTVGSAKNPSGRPGGLGSETDTPDEPQEPAGPEPLFPLVMPMETMQGGKSIRTCEFSKEGGGTEICGEIWAACGEIVLLGETTDTASTKVGLVEVPMAGALRVSGFWAQMDKRGPWATQIRCPWHGNGKNRSSFGRLL